MVDQAPIVETRPVADQTPIVEIPWPVDQAPIVEMRAMIDQAPIVEMPPVVDQAPIVEMSVVDQAPIVEMSVVDQAPIAEMPPMVDRRRLLRAGGGCRGADRRAVGGVAIADRPRCPVDRRRSPRCRSLQAPMASASPVPADEIPVAAAAATADVAPVADVAAASLTHRLSTRPSLLRFEGTRPCPSKQRRPPEDTRQAVEETVAAADLMNTLNVGAEPAVSEPTPPVWTPSAAEIPMEVTPELRGQEPVADVAERVGGQRRRPRYEMPEPVLYAEASAQA